MSEGQSVTNLNKNDIIEWIKAILIAAVLVVIIRWLIFAPYVVDGPSMHPNFFTGERLIVNKIVYHIRHPHRGEVIVFLAPEGKDYIKRVIALPGESVEVDHDKVYINGELLAEPYIQSEVDRADANGGVYNTRSFPKTTVPPGSLFVMGDNRPDSKDSRFSDVGFVSYGKVIGRADLIFWPLKKFDFIQHTYKEQP